VIHSKGGQASCARRRSEHALPSSRLLTRTDVRKRREMTVLRRRFLLHAAAQLTKLRLSRRAKYETDDTAAHTGFFGCSKPGVVCAAGASGIAGLRRPGLPALFEPGGRRL